MKVLVTGATGFVGGAVLRLLASSEGFQPRAAVRKGTAGLPQGVAAAIVGDLTSDTDWSDAVGGTDAVVHAAARVPVMADRSVDPLAEFRRRNVDGTLALARQAASAGVKRFLFISSIKVNGEATVPGSAFAADDQPRPIDPYGVSKLEAEEGLRALGQATGMETVIIRPVLVYGPGVKGNFLRMALWLDKGVPLPLGALRNKRSLVALDNLADLVRICLSHPNAANEVFLVSDGDDLSTSELLQRLGAALGKPASLLPVPSALMEGAAALIGKKAISQRLLGSLQVDINKTREQLGWTPPLSVDEALRRFVRAYRGG